MAKTQVIENNTRYRLNNGRTIPSRLAAAVACAASEQVYFKGRSDLGAVSSGFCGLSDEETLEVIVRVMEEAVRVRALIMATAPASVRREAATLEHDMRQEYACGREIRA